jgi:oxalate decarboxylase
VTQADFPISRDFSGVNMRLSAGGIRKLHWHLASERAFMTYGSCGGIKCKYAATGK